MHKYIHPKARNLPISHAHTHTTVSTATEKIAWGCQRHLAVCKKIFIESHFPFYIAENHKSIQIKSIMMPQCKNTATSEQTNLQHQYIQQNYFTVHCSAVNCTVTDTVLKRTQLNVSTRSSTVLQQIFYFVQLTFGMS